MKAADSTSIRVAAVQASPVFLDRERTITKACDLIAEAATNRARLVVFGESFIPGHPIWFHVLPATDPASIELTTALLANALTVPSAAVDALATAARLAGATVVMGAIERPDPSRARMFSSQLVISPDGEIQGVRRKLVPAVGERVILSAGGGDSLQEFKAPWGVMTALIAGENANPLLTYVLRATGAAVHCASWPPCFNRPGVMHEVLSITGRAIAYQNTTYVVAVSGVVGRDAIERMAKTDTQRELFDSMQGDPGSVIWAPRGKLLAGPQVGGEGILYADLDLAPTPWPQLVNQHYDRPDLLRVVVNRKAPEVEVQIFDEQAAPEHKTTEGAASGFEPGPDRTRRLILERFGPLISKDDVENLIPFVNQVFATSAELRDLDPTDVDARRTYYVTDRRHGD